MQAVAISASFPSLARLGLILGSLGLAALLYGAEWRQALVWLAGVVLVRVLRQRRLIPLWLAVVASLLPLLAVKTSLNFGVELLGLSFATFRAIDVLVTQRDGDRFSPLAYVVYLTFPPVLLSGPMIRWRDFHEDFQRWPHLPGWQAAGDGALMLAQGMVQALLCANLLQDFVLAALPARDYRPHMVVANALAYTAFLYFNFAGYSNMMAGICRLLGFRCPVNFRNPILSSDPRDFWRRWHVSLSEWLRDMVFFPLYRQLLRRRWFMRHSLLAQNIATFATLFLMGVWNGLKPQYVVSGAMFGLMSVAQNSLIFHGQRIVWLGRFMASRWGAVLGRVATLLGAVAAIYIFSGRGPV